MLAGYTHDLGKRGQRERRGAAIETVVAVLPGDAVEDDRRELVRGNGQIAVLADHIVTPVMLSTSDFDVGGQTVDWFRQLAARVDDASALPRHHVVLNMVDPKTTKADAALIESAIALRKQADPNPLMRPHVRRMVEALEEATDILNNVLAA
ncbi:DNA-binding protein (plasmid) [Antarctobacter heliothermus]|uniref:DNA-binding protein n=1 Tax=Antarctobacter heliothermus TaxID=74033 RepID=A0A222EB34_9RHOB|nr:DNA-binding protein [Antarctobacter heliothermus]